ncbi:MAG: ATP-binding protein [Verrucomicrobiales bacterium]|nr:ATP-binding protein [Verrucomicrobiales bacterium]
MPDTARITRIILSRFRQFGFCDIPLKHPGTGEPLSRVCFLGPNGIGKSTVLDQLFRVLSPEDANSPSSEDALVLVGLDIAGDTVFRASNGANHERPIWFQGNLEDSSRWSSLENNPPGFQEFVERFSDYALASSPELITDGLAWFSPEKNSINGDSVSGFREFLEARELDRAANYHEFLKHPDNRDRTVAEIDAEFGTAHPDVLESLQELWDPVLTPAFLEFNPADNGSLTSTQTGDEISFSALSTGLRNHLLRMARLHAHYFQKPNCGGFLFLDDPDTGLNPDLARSQMQFFLDLFAERTGQIFTTTHSPRVASLFAAEERISLRFDSERGVAVGEKISPRPAEPEKPSEEEEISDTGPITRPIPTPNQERLSQIKREMEETEDQDELADLLDEMMALRRKR